MVNDIKVLNHAADNIRILAASMVEKAKSGHPGGAMGGADFINVLYSEFLQYDPENPYWAGRDRFFLDPGHMAPMLYAQLALIGKYSLEELQQLRQWGSPTHGHPEFNIARGIENTSGPLGQGHVFAVGAAIAAKFLAAKTGNPSIASETIYAYISDGGVQEEISQGAGRIAGTLGLDNLIMFYDSNDIQLSTECDAVTTENTAMKYQAWGWKVIEINGNDAQAIREALKEAMNLARLGNKYLQEPEPWKVAKTDMERVATILNVALQICANLCVAFEPFLPFSSEKLQKMLGLKDLKWADLGRADILKAGDQIGQAELLFEKIEDPAIEAQLERLARIKKENEIKAWKPAEVQPEVAFDDFLKLDIRVGTVEQCERVPKADKLLKFFIDDGMEKRTIVSGIAKYYKPEELVGRQVCFVANFAPRKLKGVESQGMILSAENADGRLVVVGPTGPVTPGSQVK